MRKLPFFIPMQSCPNRCIYCNQWAITGQSNGLTAEKVLSKIEKIDQPVEICFFGGSFTCLPPKIRTSLLEAATRAPKGSRIRMSTHPLCITEGIIDELKEYNVSAVELGISSLDDEILAFCKRGYTSEIALEKLKALLSAGFVVGAQLMTGLPYQQTESTINDLKKLSKIKGPSSMQIRLYPCLVFPGTELFSLWEKGSYTPLTEELCIKQTAQVLFHAENMGFEILRIGLHETDSLRGTVKAGPAHPALGELVRSEALIEKLIKTNPKGPWIVSTRHRSLLSGHSRRGITVLANKTGLTESELFKRIIWW